jgi:hypothetical protein
VARAAATVVAVVIMLAAGGACGRPTSYTTYFWPVWIDSGIYALAVDTPGDPPTVVEIRGGRQVPVNLTVPANCPVGYWISLVRLSRDEFAALRMCDDGHRLLRYRTFDTPVELATLGGAPSGITWDSTGSRGWATVSFNDCDSIAPIRDGRRAPVDDFIAAYFKWPLDADLAEPHDDGTCDGRGRAALAMTRDHDVVFFASPSAQDFPSRTHGRDQTPWSMFVADESNRTVRERACCFHGIKHAALAPDQSVVAVTGLYKGVRGLWLVNVASGEVKKVADGAFTVLAWSPDGRSLAVASVTSAGDSFRTIRP